MMVTLHCPPSYMLPAPIIVLLFVAVVALFGKGLFNLNMESGDDMNFHIEYAREADGRWLAEVPEIPGVLTYGATANEAMGKAEALALRVLAERIEAGECGPIPITIAFAAA